MDSSSSDHHITAGKHCPGATVIPPKEPSTYTCATGGTVKNKRIVSMSGADAVYTQEGNNKEIEWTNADVDFQILSTKRIAKLGNLVG